MKYNFFHLLLLPLLLCGMISGCIPVQAAATQTDTGGIRIVKTDALGNPLTGARFRIAREARWQELQDSAREKFLLKVGGEYLTMVWEAFSTGLDGEVNQDILVTDENGAANAYGLSYGTYYLVETRPPAGYPRMEQPTRIRVSRYSHLTEADQVYDDEGRLIDNTIHIVTLSREWETDKRALISMLTAGISGIVFSVAVVILMGKIRERALYLTE